MLYLAHLTVWFWILSLKFTVVLSTVASIEGQIASSVMIMHWLFAILDISTVWTCGMSESYLYYICFWEAKWGKGTGTCVSLERCKLSCDDWRGSKQYGRRTCFAWSGFVGTVVSFNTEMLTCKKPCVHPCKCQQIWNWQGPAWWWNGHEVTSAKSLPRQTVPKITSKRL